MSVTLNFNHFFYYVSNCNSEIKITLRYIKLYFFYLKKQNSYLNIFIFKYSDSYKLTLIYMINYTRFQNKIK